MTILAFLCVLGIVQAILLGAVLFFAKNNRNANRLLAAFSWVVAIWVSASVMRSSGLYHRFPHISYVVDPFFFCALPILFLYVRALLSGQPLTRRDAWHFAPAVVVALYLLPWHTQPPEVKQLVLRDALPGGPYASWFYIKAGALLVQGVGYISAIFWISYRHAKTVDRPMRAARAYVFRNARFAIGVLVVFWIAGILRVLQFFGYVDRFGLQENLILPFMVTVLVYLVCYSALRHPERLYGPEDPARKYERSGLSPEAAKAGLERLTTCMDAQKPYLDGGLTLQQLGEKVGLAPNHLSQIVNDTWKMGFQEFLNSYRVKAAESRLLDPTARERTVLEIAYEVGFNSKSAFNAAFQRHRGMTPTEFRRKSAEMA